MLKIYDLMTYLEQPHDVEAENTCIHEIEVLTPSGFSKIEGMLTTEKLSKRRIILNSGNELIAAHRHRVFTESGWKFLSDITVDESIMTQSGYSKVSQITDISEESHLYDIQVRKEHCYYTNGILSHNSHFLVQLGANAMKVGKNVLHYTFELTEHAVGLRYDANFSGISATDVPERKEDILKVYENTNLGRLIIKEYPTSACTVQMIRNHIEKLMLKNFIPSVIIIDYADIMKSSKSYDSLRHELKLIYEELRNLAMEMNLPVWSASQSNKEGATSDVVGLENMAESYGKAMVADFVVSISRKPTEKSSGAGRLFIAKNRVGKDGIVYALNIDTALSRFTILDDSQLTLNESVSGDENDMRKTLQRKWKEINS